MKLIKQIIIGIVIGGGMILPGVSGGVLAVVFGIYETMIESICHFFRDVKKHSLFLSPIFLGIIIGVILFGKILFFVFDKYPMEARFTFIGLILGGIPILFRELEKKGNKEVNYIALFVSFAVVVGLFVLGKDKLNLDFSTNLDNGIISYILIFITGFIYISGKIVPGISSSVMLMLIGMYQFLLNILNNPLGLTSSEYIQIIPFGLGMIVGGICLVNIIHRLIINHSTLTYSSIIGFVIGSIAAIYPGFSFNQQGIISVTLMIIAFFIAYTFTLTKEKESKHC